MQQDEIDALAKKLKATPAKPRARRSDFGSTRGPRAGGSKEDKNEKGKEKENQPEKSRKRKRTTTVPAAAQMPPMYKSAEHIEESDEDNTSDA